MHNYFHKHNVIVICGMTDEAYIAETAVKSQSA